MKREHRFATIRTEGGLLPADLLARVAEGDKTLEGLDPTGYHLAPGERLNEAVSRSWNRLLGAWENFATALADAPDSDRTATALTRNRWSQVLFQELGYGQLQTAKALTVDGKEYPVSHLWEAVPVHLVGARVDLDRRTSGVAGAARMSPHGLVQELLNRSDTHLWGFVSNGLRLRLLRDNVSLTRQAFVEFDLEAMLTGQAYADFVILWLLCHQSRVEGDIPEKCLLERWSAEAAQRGTRALEQLRGAVESAIATMGEGFLAHPANGELRDRLRSGVLDRQDYYRQLLRLVYRLLFVSVAEARDVLNDPAADATAKERYQRFYSLERIRDLAETRRGGSHGDLLAQLQLVFRALGDDGGCPELALPSLGSFLWSADATPDLDHALLANRHLLGAVRTLSSTREGKVTRTVDYRNLGSEELGSVYESLLELHPELNVDARTFSLSTASGHERKTTGSYYTPTSLIKELLDSALDPVLAEAAAAPDPETAILDLKVLDPAVGSGHFLIAAGHRIAKRLAAIRTGDDEPSPDALRCALRDVVGRCLHGIDINPMAVELCKVSLWMEAVEPGKPLSFLDHRIVLGNSLLGTTPRLVAEGIPDDAFKPIEGDDKPVASNRKKRNANERQRRAQGLLPLGSSAVSAARQLAEDLRSLDAEDDATMDGILRKQRRWDALRSAPNAILAKLVADTWCVAFLVPKTTGTPPITDATLRNLVQDRLDDPAVLPLVGELSDRYALFHPYLAFPNVFLPDDNAENGWTGGFDLVLGNPPWDTLSPDQREFFSRYQPGMRSLSPDEQGPIIDELLSDPAIATEWTQHRRDLFATVHFFKNSRRYTLFAPGNLGKGDFNVYRMFVEAALRMTRPGGFTAQIVPGGLYGGANASAIRQHLLDVCQLQKIWGLINTQRRWFPEADIDRFSAYVARAGGFTGTFNVQFGLARPEQLVTNPSVIIDAAEIRAQNPQTYAISDIRDPAELTANRKMYAAWPPFGERLGGVPYRHYQAEIHMGNDRGLFTTDPAGLPVYEGRMIDHFDHRAKTYREGHGNSAKWDERPFGDPGKAIVPQWRVLPNDIPRKLGDRPYQYRIGFGDVANPRNERSFVAALIPPGTLCGHKVPTIAFEWDWSYLPLLAIANSFVIDWLARSRLSAPTMSYTLLDSLPLPRLPLEDHRVGRLAPIVLRLVCTGPEMTPYWNRMATYGWSTVVSEGRVPPDALDDVAARREARAEIDAVVAKLLFGLTADELDFILDTFPVLRRREERRHGEFLTKRRVMEWYEKV